MKSNFAGLSPDACFVPSHLPFDADGYPAVSNGKGGKSKGHRLAYRMFCGVVPHGAMVLHDCGNANCINPHHLYLGDAAQNARDRSRHGTVARGLALPQTRLSDADVVAIRSSTLRVTDLAKVYQTSKGNISSIRSGKNRPGVGFVAVKVEG
jgi:hypothetical protein